MKLAKVTISFKDGVLDPQEAAVKAKLLESGYKAIKEMKQLKQFEIKLNVENEEEAEVIVREICEKFLANPVIEDYKFEIMEV